jgi:hypothetical protein
MTTILNFTLSFIISFGFVTPRFFNGEITIIQNVKLASISIDLYHSFTPWTNGNEIYAPVIIPLSI